MDDLAERHLDLAHIIASKTLRGCPPQITFDDLCSAAYLGLVQAARIYDPDRGVPFRAFASWRIKGAVVDELRGHEVVSRQDRRHIREVDAFEQSFTASVGRAPSAEEIADGLDMSLDRLEAVRDAGKVRQVGVDDANEVIDLDADPEGEGVDRAALAMIARAIGSLPERHAVVITAVYVHGRTLAETGEALGVTESRACQIRAEAILLLQAGITGATPPGGSPRIRRAFLQRFRGGQGVAA